ncbi:MAG: flagellar hook-basal body complex protein FliE [Spirochaetia bacterium]|nr:flagellar hook-basal body complex protein FliE [Spirochaetota bacterium]MDW8112490.1 flagellar hook-basal body complex protein FliE [Spirochaetia bacterium]
MISFVSDYNVELKASREKHFTHPKDFRSRSVEESFGEVLLKAFDDVRIKESSARQLQELAIVSPEEVNVHEIMIAEEEARLSLLFVKTVIEKGIGAWKDLLNLR